ncbi:uncharacterized protein LOC133845763 [Drosophila sulfurigaster albostrigata]|uniref:uncharacterized protein LOC133845763 n=1 Tax=Drosophila sulfurigaster albostrigata TaxID=89887 RepID=UPI002D21E3B6|nr:uncharacterized protein LOC133845763 [Drosophila sulfurigaster albostrigata]
MHSVYFTLQVLTMFLAKFLSVLLIACALAQALPLDDFSSEDDRINEISAELGRKLILPNVDRLFSSAEDRESTKQRESPSNNINRKREIETTKSSKHAHGMITSMLSFVSSVLNFGKTIIRNE